MRKTHYFLTLLLLGGLPTAQADWVLKQEVKTEMPAAMQNMPGMDSAPQKQTTFTRTDAIRIEQGDGQVMIMRLRGKKFSLFMIDTNKKTYSDATQMLPMISMGAMFFIDCNDQGCKERKDFVVPAGKETKVINGFKTRKATMNLPKGMIMGGAAPTVWLTKDSKKLAAEERARMTLFARGLASMLRVKSIPDLVQKSHDNIVKQFGVPVETVMNMGEMKSITRVVSIEEKKLADALFDVPKGYKKENMFPGMPGGMPMPPQDMQ